MTTVYDSLYFGTSEPAAYFFAYMIVILRLFKLNIVMYMKQVCVIAQTFAAANNSFVLPSLGLILLGLSGSWVSVIDYKGRAKQ